MHMPDTEQSYSPELTGNLDEVAASHWRRTLRRGAVAAAPLVVVAAATLAMAPSAEAAGVESAAVLAQPKGDGDEGPAWLRGFFQWLGKGANGFGVTEGVRAVDEAGQRIGDAVGGLGDGGGNHDGGDPYCDGTTYVDPDDPWAGMKAENQAKCASGASGPVGGDGAGSGGDAGNSRVTAKNPYGEDCSNLFVQASGVC